MVELAFVMPVILLLIMGAIDIGRALSVHQTLTETARAAARLYSVGNVSEAQVQAIIDTSMSNARMTGYTTTFDPPVGSEVGRDEPVTVTISIPFHEVSFLPRSWFMHGTNLRGVCTMPAEPRGDAGAE